MSFLKSIKKSLGIDIERPPHEVLQKIDENIEIRKYEATKWVCTSTEMNANAMSSFIGPMFNKLFRYITGQNENNEKISMTSPVTFDFKKQDENLITENSNLKMAMRFYVPKNNQNNTPKPTGDAYLEENPEMTVAVIRFGGYASINDYIKYRDELISKLGNESKNYDCINMMAAGYDPPFKPFGRTNEVWLRKL